MVFLTRGLCQRMSKEEDSPAELPRTLSTVPGTLPSPGTARRGVFGRWGQWQEVKPSWVALEGNTGTWPPPPTASGHPPPLPCHNVLGCCRHSSKTPGLRPSGRLLPGISRPWVQPSSKAATELHPQSMITSGIPSQGWKLMGTPRSQGAGRRFLGDPQLGTIYKGRTTTFQQRY